jgi:hypothetical protein
MSAGYKVWHCSYDQHGSYQYHKNVECVVVAEIKSKALGMALTANPETHPAYWDAVEIEVDHENVHYISSFES